MANTKTTGKMQEILQSSDVSSLDKAVTPIQKNVDSVADQEAKDLKPGMTLRALERFANREPDPGIEEAMERIREARAAAHAS